MLCSNRARTPAMSTAAGNWKDLVKACTDGDLTLARYWLEQGVDPNYQHPEYQHTALMAAARAGQVAIMKLLVEKGANPHATSDFDMTETALDFAISADQKEAIAYLRELGVEAATMPSHSGTAIVSCCVV